MITREMSSPGWLSTAQSTTWLQNLELRLYKSDDRFTIQKYLRFWRCSDILPVTLSQGIGLKSHAGGEHGQHNDQFPNPSRNTKHPWSKNRIPLWVYQLIVLSRGRTWSTQWSIPPHTLETPNTPEVAIESPSVWVYQLIVLCLQHRNACQPQLVIKKGKVGTVTNRRSE